MKYDRFSADSLPEPPINPPEVEQTSKEITVFVRFAGVDKITMTVPADFDLTDSQAITDYMNEWTKEHRPSWAGSTHPDDWQYTNYIIGEFWKESKYRSRYETFIDPDKGATYPARIFIEAVEEG